MATIYRYAVLLDLLVHAVVNQFESHRQCILYAVMHYCTSVLYNTYCTVPVYSYIDKLIIYFVLVWNEITQLATLSAKQQHTFNERLFNDI